MSERARVVSADLGRLAEAMAIGVSAVGTVGRSQSQVLEQLDMLLDSIALALQHTRTYDKFIITRYQEATADPAAKPAIKFEPDYVGVVHELAGHYAVLEEAYLSSALALAEREEVALDHISIGAVHGSLGPAEGVGGSLAQPQQAATKEVMMSSIAEDAFYVIDKCIDRAKATDHVASTCAVINTVVKKLEDHLAAALNKRVLAIRDDAGSLSAQGQERFDKLRQAAISQAQALSKGKTTQDTGTGEAQAVADVLKQPETTLNTLSQCILNVAKLRVSLEEHAELADDESGRLKLKNSVDGLLETVEVFRRTLGSGLDRLVSQAKPRLRAQMDSTLGAADVSFEVSEQEYAASCGGDADQFIWALLDLCETCIREGSEKLDLDNAGQIGLRVASFVAKGIEHAVVSKRFTQFGALLLDKQLRDVVRFFDGRYGLEARQRFRRLQQIVDLLNLDRVEDVHDVYTDSSSGLAPVEVKRVLAFRTDFRTEDIKRLKM